MSITDTVNYDFKNICLKENVHLKREKQFDIYSLQLYLENKNYNLYDIINLKMYNLLYDLNRDNFEKIEIKHWRSSSEVDILFMFLPFGKQSKIQAMTIILVKN